MQLTFFFSVIILLHSVTFSFQLNGWKKISFNHGLHMTDQSNIHDTTLDGKLHIQTRDMKLTETLESRVKNKVGKVLEKLGKDILSVNVVLRIHRFPLQEHHTTTVKKDSHIVEATVRFKGGQIARASERTDDMYASIDLLSHKLAEALKKHNDKQRTRYMKIKRSRKEEEAIESMDEFMEEVEAIQATASRGIDEKELDDYLLAELDERYREALLQPKVALNNQVVKKKVFDMTPISVDEAIGALELLDHPFYVFRNSENGEVNVVYRRRDGGVGHIMPNSAPQ